jgi:cytochrome oxidase Cu insertion factor (SCO1/SenC/PrrC family)
MSLLLVLLVSLISPGAVERSRSIESVAVVEPITVGSSPQSQADKWLRGTPIGVGDLAPDFTLEDQNGKQVTLSAARGKSPVVLVFYRGYW